MEHEGLVNILSAGREIPNFKIVVSVPHGGTKESTFSVRTNGVLYGDDHTDVLAELFHQALLTTATEQSYIIQEEYTKNQRSVSVITTVSQLQRKFCDLNRPKASGKAFECVEGENFYDFYHSQIARAVQSSPETKVVLIDLHGQSNVKNAVLYRTSFDQLVFNENFEIAINRYLTKRRIKMINLDENAIGKRFHGFTVQTYGKANIFAIQVETGLSFRKSTDSMRAFAHVLANAIIRNLHKL
jgi:hypothetical protein